MTIVRLLPLAVLCLYSRSVDASPEAQTAANDLKNSRTCGVSGLGPMRNLIKRYKYSSDADTQIVVAKARYAEAFTYWFRGNAASDPFLKRIIQRYDRAGNPKLEAIAADARLLIVMKKRSPRSIKKYIYPVIVRYKNTDDPDLAQAYAKALHQLSGLEKEAGHIAEAQRLYDEAGEVYVTKVNPHRPPPDTNVDIGDICI